MMKYILKRLLWFIPTFFVVTILAFYISRNAPGDPVEILSGAASPAGGTTQQSVSQQTKDEIRKKYKLDRPVFYFSMGTQADCDTLYKITNKRKRYAFYRLSRHFGNWQPMAAFYLETNRVYAQLKKKTPEEIYASLDSVIQQKTDANELKEKYIRTENLLMVLQETSDPVLMQLRLDTLKQIVKGVHHLPVNIKAHDYLQFLWNECSVKSNATANLIPDFQWHGFDNQYHFWLKNFLKGDFGVSYLDQQPIAKKIWEKFFISFKLILFSVILAYLISIPVGIWSAKKYRQWPDKISAFILFLVYSVPSFFMGMILLFFFANPDYLVWFPESGYMDPATYNPEASFIDRFVHEWPFMILPLITYTYSSFAFISRIIRSSMLEQLNQDYIRTAYAKGLSENKILYKHAFRNSLLPVITLFVNIFPAAVGGSVIVETIFTYPGMGYGSYEAIHNYDYPVIVAIFTLAGMMSMVAYLVADILYAWADPRISYSKKI
jgi:peptide/nickel transport system permease protein